MKKYLGGLGNGVYAEFNNGYIIKLTTENGNQVNETFYLSLETLFNLNEFVKKVEF